MLLAERAEVVGLREDGALHFVTWDRATGAVTVVGVPDAAAIRQAVQARRLQYEGVLCQEESAGHVARALPGWRREAAILHLQVDSSRLPALEPMGPGGMHMRPFYSPQALPVPGDRVDEDVVIRFLSSDEVENVKAPEDLKRELTLAVLLGRVAATVVGKEPVSFCYAGPVTESLWDVSIDTLEERRRRGYASLCVAFMVDHMHREGKRPVWGAAESNAASLGLARRLGFGEVDRVVLFEESAP